MISLIDCIFRFIDVIVECSDDKLTKCEEYKSYCDNEGWVASMKYYCSGTCCKGNTSWLLLLVDTYPIRTALVLSDFSTLGAGSMHLLGVLTGSLECHWIVSSYDWPELSLFVLVLVLVSHGINQFKKRFGVTCGILYKTKLTCFFFSIVLIFFLVSSTAPPPTTIPRTEQPIHQGKLTGFPSSVCVV